MKNLIILTSSLTITEYKTYKSYLPIVVLQGSSALISTMQNATIYRLRYRLKACKNICSLNVERNNRVRWAKSQCFMFIMC